jgi:DNA-binding NarL/FixJ family response regulator
MPGGGGVPATASIAQTHPGTAVVVLTMSDDDDSVFAALRAGARGYLLKESEGADIARAVRAAARSEAVFGPRIADRVLAFFASSRGRASAVPFPELTDREREVLDLVAHGLPNAAIATRLFLSEKTVRNRVSDVLTKLHAASRAEAVALARDAGLGPSR